MTFIRAVLLCLLALLPLQAFAQETAPDISSVAALRDALAADSSVNEEERARLSERLNAAARDLDFAVHRLPVNNESQFRGKPEQ